MANARRKVGIIFVGKKKKTDVYIVAIPSTTLPPKFSCMFLAPFLQRKIRKRRGETLRKHTIRRIRELHHRAVTEDIHKSGFPTIRRIKEEADLYHSTGLTALSFCLPHSLLGCRRDKMLI